MPKDARHDSSWFASSSSGTTNANGVEIRVTDNAVAVRDSKNPDGPRIHFRLTAWQWFVNETGSE
jgi:hypothetical protein